MSLQQPIVLAADTQPPVLHSTSTGNFVDSEGNVVDLTKYELNVNTVTTVPETQLQSDDETLDDIPATQDDDSSLVPTQMTVGQTPLVNCSATSQATQEVPVSKSGTSSVIEISSGESSAKKRKLMAREAESDFFEDHLLELLDAGNK